MKSLTRSIVQAVAIFGGVATGAMAQAVLSPDQAVRNLVPVQCGLEEISGPQNLRDTATQVGDLLGVFRMTVASLADGPTCTHRISDRPEVPAVPVDNFCGSLVPDGAGDNTETAGRVCALDMDAFNPAGSCAPGN